MEEAALAKWHCSCTVRFVSGKKLPYIVGSMSRNPTTTSQTDAALLVATTAHIAATNQRASKFEHDGPIISGNVQFNGAIKCGGLILSPNRYNGAAQAKPVNSRQSR
ncbi:MAG: hypothetical protein COB39_01260 [Marinosulfonomonas sp.]|nr:MAG: hypothetical protein COB39_01260 [Marinosulfonomonas sp.]